MLLDLDMQDRKLLNKDEESRIKFIFFDVGGVLMRDLSEDVQWYNFLEEIGIPKNMRKKFTDIYSRYNDQLNLGNIDLSEVHEVLESELNIKIKVHKSRFQEFMVSKFKPNLNIHQLVESLKDSFSIGLLTNMYNNMLNQIFKYRIIPELDWKVIVDSSKVKLAKPYSGIYNLAQDLAAVNANEILFIDNMLENLTYPCKIGWNTLLYDITRPEKSNKEIINMLGM